MSWLHGLRERLVTALHPGARDAELAEEIRYHIELEADRQKTIGYSTPDAQARAIARFGDPAAVIEATRAERGGGLIEGTVNDLRWAFRSLRKQAGFSTLAIATLALGIGATTTAYTVLDTVLLRPLPYRDADRLVMLEDRTAGGEIHSSFPNFIDWRAQARSFHGVASEMFPWSATVRAGSDPVRATVMGVSLGFFDVLGVPVYRGREFSADEESSAGPRAVMVSYDFWATQMGSRTELGTISYAGEAATVVGVLPPDFRFIDKSDIYFPHERWPGTCRSCSNYRVFARMAPGVTLAGAQAEMTTIVHTLKATWANQDATSDLAVVPLRDDVVGEYRGMLTVVFGAGAMVLLIACANLVSAQLARGFGRAHEIALRAALGATYARTVRQLLVESTVLAVLGATAGAALTGVLVRLVRTLGSGLIPRLEELRVGSRVFVAAIVATMLTTILIGVYPALRLAWTTPGSLLRGARGSSRHVRSGVWRALVIGEVALAVTLLIGASLLIRTFHNIVSADVGFNPAGLLTVAFSPDESLDMPMGIRLTDEVRAVPGVRAMAWTNRPPMQWGNGSGPVLRPGDPSDHDWPAFAGFRIVSPEYFAVLGQPLLKGRAFSAADRAGAPEVAIVTNGLASRLWPGQDPVGKQVMTNYLSGHWLTVVGVVPEASSWTMPRGSQNEIFTPLAQQAEHLETDLVAIVRVSGDPHALIPSLRARIHATLPQVPARFDTIEDRIGRSAADRRFAMLALSLFGGVALLLAGIGVYGTMSYIVTAQTRDLGVRMALGASPRRLLGSVLAQAAAMTTAGLAIGILIGISATRYLDGVLFGVSRTDAASYIAGAVMLLVTALAGAFVPAWRSSRVDPLTAIRIE